MLPFGAMMTTIFVGWFMHKPTVEDAVDNNLGSFFGLWYAIVKYIAPIALILVMFGLIGMI